MIGVHTPEFDFEKDPVNVAEALMNLQVNWPVLLDNEFRNWRNFANRYWPSKYLFDQNGYLVYESFGEGHYPELEKKIQEYLKKDFGDKSLPKVETYESPNFCFLPTPETYLGFLRGRIANKGGFHEDHLGHYVFPGKLNSNEVALSGEFLSKSEYAETFDEGSTIYINFTGSEVNLVMEKVNHDAIVEVMLNGKTIPESIAGRDLDQGDAVLWTPRMYNLLKSEKSESGILSIRAKGGNFRAYAFTFSGCID